MNIMSHCFKTILIFCGLWASFLQVKAQGVTEVWSVDDFTDQLTRFSGLNPGRMVDFVVLDPDEFLLDYRDFTSDVLKYANELRVVKRNADGSWTTKSYSIDNNGFSIPDMEGDQFFVLKDSGDNPVLATSYIDRGDFCVNVFPIQRNGDKFTIVNQYLLELPFDDNAFKNRFKQADYLMKSPAIEGDASKGDFRLMCILWDGSGNSDAAIRHSMFQWVVNGGTTVDYFYDSEVWTSCATIQALGDNLWLVDDKNILTRETGEQGTYDCHCPTILSIGDNGIEIVSSMADIEDTNFGTGATIFSVGNSYCLFRTDTEEITTQSRSVVPVASKNHKFYIDKLDSAGLNDANAMNARSNIWESPAGAYGTEDFLKMNNIGTYEDQQMARAKAVSDNEGNVDLYVRSGSNHMTRLRIAGTGTSTGLHNLEGATTYPERYFTLTGAEISAPTRAGIYIRQTGSQIRKIALR